jgi:ATP-dependent DNA ligase
MPKFKQRSNIQLCYPFSEERLLNQGRLRSVWHKPYIYQDKFNGERGRALVESKRVLLFSSTGELITTLPHLNKQLQRYPEGEYDGELYHHGWSFSRIHSAISTEMSIHPDAPRINYHIFDVINDQPQGDRIMYLSDIWSSFKHLTPNIKQVCSMAAWTLDDIMTLYNGSIAAGYEGFVVKDISSTYVKKDPAYRSPYWMKFKPKKRDIYPILAIEEAISQHGEPLKMVGSFLCSDSEGNTFSVGAGKLTHLQRKEILHSGLKENSFLLIEFQTLSDAKGVPHFSRAVQLIEPEDD